MTLFRHRAWPLMLIAGAISLVLQAAGGRESSAPAQFAAPVVMDLPDYLQVTRDPVFGTVFTRITKPGALGEGIVCGDKYCSHRYSSSQAWNSDQSLLVIANGCAGMCFFDGRTDRKDIQFVSTNYSDLQFGPYKGNPSLDGDQIAVRATRNNDHQVVFAYDVKQRQKFPDINLAQIDGTNNACSISPLGVNILCFQTLENGTEQASIFSVDGTLRQKWTEHHRPGHGDITVDTDGSEIYVGISKSDPDKYQVIKRRLSDGKVTSLTKYGEAQHASLRSLSRPGWVFLTYTGNPDQVSRHPDWAPYAREVTALRIDGSGDVRRIVQTRNVPFDYWSETHASPSPDGLQVIWSSNWGAPGGSSLRFRRSPRLASGGPFEVN